MRFIENYSQELKRTPWNHNNESTGDNLGMTLIEGQTYYSLVRHYKPKLIIEAGTHVGNSTWFLLMALLQNEKEGHPGIIHTIDVQNHKGSFKAVSPLVFPHWETDIIDWLKDKKNKKLIKACDFFSHDDAHWEEHIDEEISFFTHVPIITCHDIQTESKAWWDKVTSNKDYLPNYTRHETISKMGVGWLTKKNHE